MDETPNNMATIAFSEGAGRGGWRLPQCQTFTEPEQVPSTFDIKTNEGGSITLTRCHYQRGSHYIKTEYEPSCAIATGTLYAIINTNTGEITCSVNPSIDPSVTPELFPVAIYDITADAGGQTATVNFRIPFGIVSYE
jgi:hypothetical protein